MEAAISGNIGLMVDGELGRNSLADFDMKDLNASAKPASIESAIKYRNETCIRNFKDGKYYPYPIFGTSLKTLGEHGVGLELYFKLIKSLGVLFFIISCISIYPIYENNLGSGLSAGDIRERWDTWNVSNLDIVTTQSDLDNNNSELLKIFICDAVCSSLFIICIMVFRSHSNKTVTANYQDTISLADYSVEVKGLPGDASQSHVLEHFSKFGAVKEVYLARSYGGILSYYKERASLSYDLAYYRLLEKNGKKNPIKIAKILKKIENFDRKIELNEKNSDKTNDELPVIRGFIVFEEMSTKKKCLNDYEKDKNCCKRLKNQKATLKFLGKFPLRVQRTASPSNIIWENLEVSKCQRFWRRLLSLICVLLALIASIIMVYALKSYQDNLPSSSDCAEVDSTQSLSYAKQYYTTDTQSYCYCKGKSLNTVINNSNMYSYCTYFLEKISVSILLRVSVSVGVIFVNFFIKIFFRILSRFEKVNNKSTEQLKLMSKVFIASFINTALVVLAVNANFSQLGTYSWLPKYIFNASFYDFSRQWYVQVGSTITTTMLVTIFSPHCVFLLTFYPLGVFKRHCCLSRHKTQKEINQKFSGADFDLATRNAFVLIVVFTCYLYSGGMPIMNVICCLTMFTLYWVDKYLILRHYKKPTLCDQRLNDRVLHYLPYAVVFHCGFTLYMYGATDIFPYNLDYSTQNNTIPQRIKSVSGFVNIIIGISALCISVIEYFYSKVFKCILKNKITVDKDEKNSKGNVENQIDSIRRHELGSYDIIKNPAYSDLVIAMNTAAYNVKVLKNMNTINS
jgi:Calcium-dependent channel, 7TM region, putative phosphate